MFPMKFLMNKKASIGVSTLLMLGTVVGGMTVTSLSYATGETNVTCEGKSDGKDKSVNQSVAVDPAAKDQSSSRAIDATPPPKKK